MRSNMGRGDVDRTPSDSEVPVAVSSEIPAAQFVISSDGANLVSQGIRDVTNRASSDELERKLVGISFQRRSF